ncbi:MAG: signal peptidase I [Cetobacterium sp.]
MIGVISSSMSPTINISDYIMYKTGRNIERNKLIRVKNIPSPDGSSFITVGKRVAAIPGDAVFVCDFEVYINEISFYKNPKPMSECLHTENILIKNGEIYLLGDNKFDSYDSRYFGTVSIDNVDGVALYKISTDSKVVYL